MRPSLRQVLFRSAGLDLNFAGGVFSLNNTRTDSPASIPGWSFSRTDTNAIATALDLAGNVIQFPSRTNLLLQSQTFDDAGWTKGGSTVTANATAAPDESITADKLVEDTSTGLHRLSQIVAKASSATTYTFTVFAKASERTQLRLALDDVGANNGGATFDLSNGTISTAAAVTGDFTNASASITAVGSWYRLALTVTSNTVTSIRAQTQMAVSGSISYTGVAGSGLFLWGAQLETGSTATAYIPTTTAAVTVVLPRITDRGILVEEARTNGIRNSVAAGAVVGTPGTLPTNWTTFSGSNGLSPQIVAVGTDSVTGTGFVEVRFSGTTVNNTGSQIKFEGGIAAANAQTWTASVYAALVAGSVSGFTSGPILQFDMNNSVPAYVGNSTAVAVAGSASMTRGSVTFTTNQATTAFVSPYIVITPGTGKTVDFTLRISVPQMELGAFATSPIITTGAAGTRGADLPVLTPVAFSQPFTVAAEWDLPLTASQSIQTIAYWTNATGYIRRIRAGSSETAFQLINDANVLDLNLSVAGATAAGVGRASLRAQTNDARPALNSALLSLDTSCDIATMTIVRVGTNGAAEQLNGYVRRIRVLPFAATDAQLQALTAP